MSDKHTSRTNLAWGVAAIVVVAAGMKMMIDKTAENFKIEQ